jgi:hypothetical protein
MANEINIQAALTVQRYSPPVQGSGSKDVSPTGTGCAANIQKITTTAVALTLGNITTANLGYLFVKHLGSANVLSLGLDSAVTSQIFAKLAAGEFCLLPANQVSYYGKSDAAGGIDVLVVAAEK